MIPRHFLWYLWAWDILFISDGFVWNQIEKGGWTHSLEIRGRSWFRWMGILTPTTQTLDCHFGSKGLIAWNRFGQWTATLLRGKVGLQSKLWTSITCNNTIYFYSISRTMVVNDGLAGVCVSHERNVKCAVRLCPPLVWGVHWLSVFGTPQVMGNIYLPLSLLLFLLWTLENICESIGCWKVYIEKLYIWTSWTF